MLNEGLRKEESKGIKKHCREPSTGAIARNQSQNPFLSEATWKNSELRNEKKVLEERDMHLCTEKRKGITKKHAVKKKVPWYLSKMSCEKAVGVGLLLCGKARTELLAH